MSYATMSLMRQEALEIAERVSRLIDKDLPGIPGKPQRVYTVGRGSSDHAALVIHHLLASAGITCSCMPMSLIAEVIDSSGSLFILISQSGASPDICDAAIKLRLAGSPVLSLVNLENSRLESESSHALSQSAGNEIAVAATKSVVCSIIVGARLAQSWGATSSDLDCLPEQIRTVQNISYMQLTALFVAAGPILVIGRGSSYGIACEIALKIQELLGRAAMAFSSSEVLHGPAGMISSNYSVLALALGPERNDVLSCVDKLKTMGANCHVLKTSVREDKLAATLMLCQVYLALEEACVESGYSPDEPRNLSKITMT